MFTKHSGVAPARCVLCCRANVVQSEPGIVPEHERPPPHQEGSTPVNAINSAPVECGRCHQSWPRAWTVFGGAAAAFGVNIPSRVPREHEVKSGQRSDTYCCRILPCSCQNFRSCQRLSANCRMQPGRVFKLVCASMKVAQRDYAAARCVGSSSRCMIACVPRNVKAGWGAPATT